MRNIVLLSLFSTIAYGGAYAQTNTTYVTDDDGSGRFAKLDIEKS